MKPKVKGPRETDREQYDSAAPCRCWLLHYRDRDPEQVYFVPPVTQAEALAAYPAAIGASPMADIGEPPASAADGSNDQADDEILTRAAELDSLICRLCALVGFSPDARGRMLAARRRMAPAQLPIEIKYFAEQVTKAEAGRYWDSENA